MPGYDVRIVDEAGHEVPAKAMGSIVVKLPLPPGSLPTLWQQDERFHESYLSQFPGYYSTSDAGFVDEDGYLYIMGRTDDIINVAGHRLSTGGMEEVLASHPMSPNAPSSAWPTASRVRRCLRLRRAEGRRETSGRTRWRKSWWRWCATKDRPVAAFKLAITVSRLPKTRSGKILRGTMKKIADRAEVVHAGHDR